VSHPYADFLRDFAQTLERARRLPLGGLASLPAPARRPDAPRTLIFAPHPDDECIVGALPLRLQRELGHAVGVVAVTAGSNAARRAPRLEELRGACGFLGWDGIAPEGGSLSEIKPEARAADPAAWARCVAAIAEILKVEKPALILFPHARDANSTHQGVHLLLRDALKSLGPSFRCAVAETEYWSGAENPNLLIESSTAEVADLVAALSFHAGEVSRNPYHALLPCWMADNVRRGGELIGGQGGDVPNFLFATLYRFSLWNGASLAPAPSRVVASGGGLAALLK
jgi:LmbE family N-acetylglucosaminyl deacetylase